MTPTTPTNRVGRWAGWALVGALALAALGRYLEHRYQAPFWGGLLLAFAEAALVGGLADWFAVRALFGHPFGIPFPHTALIPRNRARIVGQIRDLVLNEWLPRSLLTAKVEAFDFVGQGLLPVVEPLKPHLRSVVREVARSVLDEVSPHHVAGFLARGLSGAVDADKVGPFLGDLARRVREGRWLEPLLREWVQKLGQWADTPESREVIVHRLRGAAESYQQRHWFKRVTFQVAEVFGGVDIEHAAGVIQAEIRRFAADQMLDDSQAGQIVRDGLEAIEARLRDDPQFLADARSFLLETSNTGTLPVLLEPALRSLRDEGVREVESDDSRFLALAMRQIDDWVARLEKDPEMREQLNGWCRRQALQLIDRHHGLLGVLVEEQLNRLSEENLSALIQAKVGEDLNWIRLNGTFVGGLVGASLYLMFRALGWLMG